MPMRFDSGPPSGPAKKSGCVDDMSIHTRLDGELVPPPCHGTSVLDTWRPATTQCWPPAHTCGENVIMPIHGSATASCPPGVNQGGIDPAAPPSPVLTSAETPGHG